MNIHAVILAGGSGTRLWPLSRDLHPKQFLRLVNQDTLLQATAKRLCGLGIQSILTICNEQHRFFVAEQLRQIDRPGPIILEPVARNTAPAIALAALATEDDSVLMVVPADHVIEHEAAFTRTVTSAMPLAASGKLVTFGVVPVEANTEYGYVKRGDSQGAGFAVDRFVEKPAMEEAEVYVKSGQYYWNSGMFLFKASRYLEALREHRPDIYAAAESAMTKTTADFDFVRIDAAAFEACPSESVDYAVMENTPDAVVVPMDAGWNDIGSWASLWAVCKKDPGGNALDGDVIVRDSTNSYVRTDERLVAAISVDNLVIVDTKDALLVADKDRVQEVRLIVQRLKSAHRPEWESHREVYRPWGKYDCIDRGERYQVKRICVNPGARLSVQMHYHRAEHWIIVAGTARVTKGEETFLLCENESTFIPAGVRHALENPGKVNLELIEVQSGCYLGEDDIVRFEDVYGRVTAV